MASAVLDSDESLAALAARGSSEAFATLYDRHFRNVYDLAARMARDSDLAGDIAQNAFVKAWDTLRKGREPEHVRAWLYTIARNTAIDEIRRQQRLVAVDDESEEQAFAAAAVAATAQADPATTAEQRELVELVWDAAASLNPREYSLLDLHVRRGLTADELATTLGQRKGAVYTMLSRLRDSLGETVTFTLLLRQGRRDCAELSALVSGNVAAELSPATRRAMRRHVPDCATCRERARRVAAPAEIFALIPLLPVAPERQAAVWRGVADHIDVAVAGGGVAAAAASQHPGQFLQHWWADASGLAKAVAVGATTAATATLLGGIGLLTFSGGAGWPAGPPAIVGQVDGGSALLAPATPTASPTPTLGAGAAAPATPVPPTAAPTPTVAVPAATPAPAVTATPIPVAATPPAPTPSAPATNDAAAGLPAAARAPAAAAAPPAATALSTPTPLPPTATTNATATLPPPTPTAAPSATPIASETPTPAPAASEAPADETPAPESEPATPTEEPSSPTEEPSSPREPRRRATSTPTPRPSPPTPTPTAPAPASPPTATPIPILPSTPTPAPTATATAVPTPSATPSATPTPAVTPTATATATPPPAPTSPPSPTATTTRTPTSTRTPTPKPPPGPAPITRVLQSNNTDPAEPGRFVLDGNLATHWETLPTTPANGWFALDLGQSRQITRARWYLGHREFAVAFRLEVSDDAQQWQTVANLSAGQSSFVWQERAIGRSGRYVRWFFTNPTNAEVLGEIGEAQVFVE